MTSPRLRSAASTPQQAAPEPSGGCSGALTALAEQEVEFVVLCGDLAHYTDLDAFMARHPDRVVQVGMAEANLIGIAAGLAKSGITPIVVTYGVFATRRAYDQIAMGWTTGLGRGVIVGFMPGITTRFSATHQSIDDVALMRVLPGMRVIDPVDPDEFAAALTVLARDPGGPAYVRGIRGPRSSDSDGASFRVGAVHEVWQGSDVGILASGRGTAWVREAQEALARAGISTALLHVPTLKPVDDSKLTEYCAQFRDVITVENHSTIGGLGSLVSELVTAAGIPARVTRLGVPDVWPPGGSEPYIRAQLGLGPDGIARSVQSALEGRRR
jgi:transketolase